MNGNSGGHTMQGAVGGHNAGELWGVVGSCNSGELLGATEVGSWGREHNDGKLRGVIMMGRCGGSVMGELWRSQGWAVVWGHNDEQL